MAPRRYLLVAGFLFALAIIKTTAFLTIVVLCLMDLDSPAMGADEMARTRSMLRLALAAGAGSLICLGSAAALTLRIRSAGILAIERALRGFGDAGFETPIPDTPMRAVAGEEIERLRRTLAEMSDRVVSRIGTLTAAEARLRMMFAELSHDFRTPLALLTGYLDNIRANEAGLPPDEQRKQLEMAARHAKRLETLVAELLELAELEADAITPRMQSLNLSELVEDVCAAFQNRAAEAGVELACESRTGISLAEADPDLLGRVFENLLDNAIRYAAKTRGWVRVTLENAGELVEVRVIDSGPGIPAEDSSRVFHPFQRAGPIAEEGGAGLGLAIVRRILQLHGSDVALEATSDRETTFRFALRRAAPEAADAGK